MRTYILIVHVKNELSVFKHCCYIAQCSSSIKCQTVPDILHLAQLVFGNTLVSQLCALMYEMDAFYM